MASYKVTFFLESEQEATFGAGAAIGWTESWYLQTSGAIDTVFTHPDVRGYISLRQLTLPLLYRISFVRVDDDSNPNLSKFQTLPYTAGYIKNNDQPATVAAQVQCAILVDFMKLPQTTGEKVHHRKFLMRGLPTSVINGNVLNRASPDWQAFVNFFDFIGKKATGTNGGNTVGNVTALGCRYQDPAFGKTPITSITPNTPANQYINVQPVLGGVVDGSKIKISGTPRNLLLNRIWTQVGTPGSSMSLGKSKYNNVTTLNFPAAGKAQLVKYSYGVFDQYSIVGLRNKKTGRVFHQLAGRSRRV